MEPGPQGVGVVGFVTVAIVSRPSRVVEDRVGSVEGDEAWTVVRIGPGQGGGAEGVKILFVLSHGPGASGEVIDVGVVGRMAVFPVVEDNYLH